MRTNKLHVMRYLSVTSVLLLLVVFVTRCSEEAAPTAFLIDSSIENPALSKTVVHHVSVGGADICEALGLPTGCDANFAFVAIEKADGSVSGQWQDTFIFDRDDPGLIRGVPVHVTIDCLNVDGNEAWVSGVVTGGPFTGIPAITRVADNGTSANDPLDQISFIAEDAFGGCQAAPDLPLIDLTHGQVKVK